MTDLIKRDDVLEPCPFCGGEASKIPDANHSTGWEVGCFSGYCDVEPHIWAVHLSTAVMQWNIRALPAVDPAAIRKAAMLDAGYDTPVDPVVNDPPDWIWYGEDNDGEIHTSLGRWQRHPCQVRYKLAEIQPTEHDHPIDPAAIREAALIAKLDKVMEALRWYADFDNYLSSGEYAPIDLDKGGKVEDTLAELEGQG